MPVTIVQQNVMSSVLHVVGHIAVATLFGSMAFFSFAVAPLIFRELDAETAGRFVRAMFPWYYLAIVALSVIAFGALAAGRPIEAAMMASVALAALISRQILMPRINRQRDRMVEGDAKAAKTFSRLHQLSVWINAAQLLAALVALVRLAVV